MYHCIYARTRYGQYQTGSSAISMQIPASFLHVRKITCDSFLHNFLWFYRIYFLINYRPVFGNFGIRTAYSMLCYEHATFGLDVLGTYEVPNLCHLFVRYGEGVEFHQWRCEGRTTRHMQERSKQVAYLCGTRQHKCGEVKLKMWPCKQQVLYRSKLVTSFCCSFSVVCIC
jgi:hypothetical protein